MFPYQKKILRDTRLESTFFHTYKTTPDGNKRFIWLLSIFKVIAKWHWYIYSLLNAELIPVQWRKCRTVKIFSFMFI